MEKVVVGWPDGGSVASLFCTSMLAMLHYELSEPDDRYEIESFSARTSIYIQENRNNLVHTLLKTDADWLLQIDGDESFPRHLLRRLMITADADERPVVVGLYTNTAVVDAEDGSIQLVNCVYREHENGQYQNVNPPEHMMPFQVDAAGTGVMLCHRRVFEALEYPWFWMELFEDEDGKRQMMNEDLGFCRSVRAAGFPIWCDPLAEVVHWKNLPLVPSTTREYLKNADKVFTDMSALHEKGVEF